MRPREKRRRRKKERTFEEERESEKPRRELVSMPFLDPDLAPSSLNVLDPGGNGEESCKEEDLEARGSGEATTRAAEEAVSFVTLFVTLRPSSLSRSSPKAENIYDLRHLRLLCRLLR
ncbi:hypothetical protein BHM03_00047389 [Ensete ventricosum]|nr:hypothetical protein BHM03_00047389 [Ensete ventricosum]